jgi:hypothetical protein
MIQRILSSKNFVACLLAAATGMALYFKLPFPAENVFLQLMGHLVNTREQSGEIKRDL